MIEIDTTIPKMSASSGVCPTVRIVAGSVYLAFFSVGEDRSVVLRFHGVRDWDYGYPNDESLSAHPLFGHGLRQYEFHRGPVGAWGERAWIATFHDGTFTIYADSVEVLEEHHEGVPEAALKAHVGEGANRKLDQELT